MRWLAALALALAGCDAPPAVDEEAQPDKPKLALLTSLPLIFDEGFSLESSGSPVLSALEEDYQVEPIALADAVNLEGYDLLFMAHAPAQTAEALVELDEWVRAGGRVLLLADPKLEWESSLPLGDRRRPLSAFPDTGLLGHWGVELVGPFFDDPPYNPAEDVYFASVQRGSFEVTKPKCRLDESSWQQPGFIAVCDLGEGKARLLADADFILQAADPDAGNLQVLMQQMESLRTADWVGPESPRFSSPTDLSTGFSTGWTPFLAPFWTLKKAQKTAKSHENP